MKFLIILILAFPFMAQSKINKNCQANLSKDLCANITFDNAVSRKKDAIFKIRFVDSNNKAVVLKEKPAVKLWMVMKSGHGHGSDEVTIDQEEKEKHAYRVSNVWFLMLGEWSIKVEAKYNGELHKAEIPVCVRKDIMKSAVGKCL